MYGCNQYSEHQWRKNRCSNCYNWKSAHPSSNRSNGELSNLGPGGKRFSFAAGETSAFTRVTSSSKSPTPQAGRDLQGGHTIYVDGSDRELEFQSILSKLKPAAHVKDDDNLNDGNDVQISSHNAQNPNGNLNRRKLQSFKARKGSDPCVRPCSPEYAILEPDSEGNTSPSQFTLDVGPVVKVGGRAPLTKPYRIVDLDSKTVVDEIKMGKSNDSSKSKLPKDSKHLKSKESDKKSKDPSISSPIVDNSHIRTTWCGSPTSNPDSVKTLSPLTYSCDQMNNPPRTRPETPPLYEDGGHLYEEIPADALYFESISKQHQLEEEERARQRNIDSVARRHRSLSMEYNSKESSTPTRKQNPSPVQGSTLRRNKTLARPSFPPPPPPRSKDGSLISGPSPTLVRSESMDSDISKDDGAILKESKTSDDVSNRTSTLSGNSASSSSDPLKACSSVEDLVDDVDSRDKISTYGTLPKGGKLRKSSKFSGLKRFLKRGKEAEDVVKIIIPDPKSSQNHPLSDDMGKSTDVAVTLRRSDLNIVKEGMVHDDATNSEQFELLITEELPVGSAKISPDAPSRPPPCPPVESSLSDNCRPLSECSDMYMLPSHLDVAHLANDSELLSNELLLHLESNLSEISKQFGTDRDDLYQNQEELEMEMKLLEEKKRQMQTKQEANLNGRGSAPCPKTDKQAGDVQDLQNELTSVIDVAMRSNKDRSLNNFTDSPVKVNKVLLRRLEKLVDCLSKDHISRPKIQTKESTLNDMTSYHQNILENFQERYYNLSRSNKANVDSHRVDELCMTMHASWSSENKDDYVRFVFWIIAHTIAYMMHKSFNKQDLYKVDIAKLRINTFKELPLAPYIDSSEILLKSYGKGLTPGKALCELLLKMLTNSHSLELPSNTTPSNVSNFVESLELKNTSYIEAVKKLSKDMIRGSLDLEKTWLYFSWLLWCYNPDGSHLRKMDWHNWLCCQRSLAVNELAKISLSGIFGGSTRHMSPDVALVQFIVLTDSESLLDASEYAVKRAL